MMKKANLLSKAELKKVMGGMDEAERAIFPCLTADCSFYIESTFYNGSCGAILDMKDCYCLAIAPNGSIISEVEAGCRS